MHISSERISVKLPAFEGKNNTNTANVVCIQCGVNFKKIDVNDELVLYRPKITRPDVRKAVMSSVDVQQKKRQKTDDI